MATIGELTVKINADGSGFNVGVQQAEQGVKKFNSSLTSMAKQIAAVGIAAGGMKAIMAGFEFNKQAEQAEIAFGVMLGSAEEARKMIAGIREDAKRTPLEFTDIRDATQTLLQFGVDASQVRETVLRLGDVSGGNAERLQSLSLAFGQMSSTGRLMGQDLNQMINAGFNPLKEISDRTGESMASLKKKMEAGAISSEMVAESFKYATSEGGKFFEMMKKQSDSLAGAQSNLSDSINQALGQMMSGATPLIKSAFVDLSKIISDSGSGLTKFGESVGGTFKLLSDLVGGVVKFFNELPKGVQDFTAALGPAAIAAAAIGAAFGPIPAIIAAAVAGLGALNAEIEKMKQPVTDFGVKIGDAIYKGTNIGTERIKELAQNTTDLSLRLQTELGGQTLLKLGALARENIKEARKEIERLAYEADADPVILSSILSKTSESLWYLKPLNEQFKKLNEEVIKNAKIDYSSGVDKALKEQKKYVDARTADAEKKKKADDAEKKAIDDRIAKYNEELKKLQEQRKEIEDRFKFSQDENKYLDDKKKNLEDTLVLMAGYGKEATKAGKATKEEYDIVIEKLKALKITEEQEKNLEELIKSRAEWQEKNKDSVNSSLEAQQKYSGQIEKAKTVQEQYNELLKELDKEIEGLGFSYKDVIKASMDLGSEVVSLATEFGGLDKTAQIALNGILNVGNKLLSGDLLGAIVSGVATIGKTILNAIHGINEAEQERQKIDAERAASHQKWLEDLGIIGKKIYELSLSNNSLREQIVKNFRDIDVRAGWDELIAQVASYGESIADALTKGIKDGLSSGDISENIKQTLLDAAIDAAIFSSGLKKKINDIGAYVSEAVIDGFQQNELEYIKAQTEMIAAQAAQLTSAVTAPINAVFGASPTAQTQATGSTSQANIVQNFYVPTATAASVQEAASQAYAFQSWAAS